MFIGRRMGNKTEQTTNIYSSIDESQKHIEKRKPDTKEYILYCSVYMKFKNKASPWSRNQSG